MRFFVTITLLFTSATLFAQTSTVKGVVTYYFNEYQGDKPDLGAKAYLIEKKEASFLNSSVIDSFINGKFYSRLYSSYLGIAADYETLLKRYEGKKRYKTEYDEIKTKYDQAAKYRDDYFEKMKLYGVETTEQFNALDRRVFNIILNISDKNSSVSTIDASGSYSFSTKPGSYYVYIVSKNRTGMSISEIQGKIFLKEIELKENQTVDVSKNFDLY